jgi:general secretion pathway protein J
MTRGPSPSARASLRGGFTLIELLVALAIFAVLSAFAYRSLAALLDARDGLERDARKWRDVALFVGRFERDVQAVLPRVATGPSGTPLAPVSSVLDFGAGTAKGLALTRAGAALAPGALAAPQRIGYRLTEGRVERHAWTAPDSAPRVETRAIPVLEGVKALDFRYLARGEWRGDWGLPGAGTELPAAVEVALQLESGERVVRLVAVPR